VVSLMLVQAFGGIVGTCIVTVPEADWMRPDGRNIRIVP